MGLQVFQQLSLAGAEFAWELVAAGIGELKPELLAAAAGFAGFALPKPAGRQGCFECAKQAGAALLRHLFDQLLPAGIHSGALVQRFDRLELAAGELQRGFVEQLHHKTNVALAAQTHLHQIAAAQLESLRIGVGENLALPARFKPHLQPSDGPAILLGVQGRGLAHATVAQACRADSHFLRWDC